MAVITTEKLSATVGALVDGVDRDRLLDDDDLPAWTPRGARGQRRAGLPRPPPRRRDPGRVQQASSARSRCFGKGEHPEIFRVTLDPAKNPSAAYLRGTFDWHIDGCTDDIPIMATMLSAHAVAESGGETEFASSYARLRGPRPTTRRTRFDGVRVVHTIEASQRLLNPDPTARRSAMLASAPAQGAPARVAAPLRPPLAGARRHHRPRRRHGPRRGPGPARRPARPRRPPPTASTATSGRSATW